MRDESIKDFTSGHLHGFEPNTILSFHLTWHHVARCQDVLLYIMAVSYGNGRIFYDAFFCMISNHMILAYPTFCQITSPHKSEAYITCHHKL